MNFNSQAVNILTISTESHDKKDFFDKKVLLSWLDLLVKISTISNTILLSILLIFFVQTAQEIKSFTEKTSLSLQVFEEKTTPFFDGFNLGKKILVYFLAEEMELPITITEEEIQEDLLKFFNISEDKVKEKQEEMNLEMKENEGKNTIFALNRSQQAYHFEKEYFTDNIDNLDIVISTDYYNVEIIKDSDNKVVSTAIPKDNNLKAYAGIIEFDQDNGIYNQLICESDNPSEAIEIPINSNECGNDSTEVK